MQKDIFCKEHLGSKASLVFTETYDPKNVSDLRHNDREADVKMLKHV